MKNENDNIEDGLCDESDENEVVDIKTLQDRLVAIETEIKSLVCDDDGEFIYLRHYYNDPLRRTRPKSLSQSQFDRLGELLFDRCCVLNSLFQATEEELTHLRRVNDHLLSLRNSLHRSACSMKQTIVPDPYFDDDYEIEGLLTFHYNGEESVLKLSNDSFYGSDFGLMASVLESYYEVLRKDNIGLTIFPEKENLLDDGQSWDQGPFNTEEFDGIIIGYALHDLCHHKDYSLPDFIRLNDFWAEVEVRVQSITTQSGERAEFGKTL